MPRVANVARDIEIQASLEPADVLAERFGLSSAHVKRIRSGAYRPAAPTRKERFQLEVVEGGWQAACMEPEEWADWVRQNPNGVYDGDFADRPCRDCPIGFAIDMRAIGRCNGTPTGAEGEPADHEEDDDMIDSRPSGGVRGTTALELEPPPCDTCLHEPICVLKIALGKVKTAEVSAMPLPDGLSVAVSARVDCRFYNPVKKSRAGAGGGAWSDERRAAQSERMRERSATGFVVGKPKAVS